MWIPDFVLKLIGHEVADKLNLGETMPTKPWYQSKTIWTGIVTALIGIYNAVAGSALPAFGHTAPMIPDWIFTLLGAIGIYSRTTTDTKIQ